MSDHAEFSPSGSSLWLNCPASVFWAKKFYRPKSGAAAQKGTDLHELAAQALKEERIPKEKKIRKYVQDVLRDRDKLKGKLLVEERVYVKGIEKHCWGTVDAAIIARTEVASYDLKTGANPVVALHNTQLLCYASGLPSRRQYRLVIHQGGKPDIWKTGRDKLKEFLFRAASAVKLAQSKTPMAVPGKWCGYCRARMFCPAARSKKPMEMKL